MNIQRIVAALNNWSPQGLCDGVLLSTGEAKTNTEACATGCLALEFLFSKDGEDYLKQFHIPFEEFVTEYMLQQEDFLSVDAMIAEAWDGHSSARNFEGAVHRYFDVNADNVAHIMEFNDNHAKVTGEALPPEVRTTIAKLRDLYIQLHHAEQ